MSYLSRVKNCRVETILKNCSCKLLIQTIFFRLGMCGKNEPRRKRRMMEYKTLEEVLGRFDQETRNYAANTLLDALLASCESQEERIELSVNLLGYDPR